MDSINHYEMKDREGRIYCVDAIATLGQVFMVHLMDHLRAKSEEFSLIDKLDFDRIKKEVSR